MPLHTQFPIGLWKGISLIPTLFLFRDEFSTDDDSPLNNPFNASHNGSWGVSDSGNKGSKSGGALRWSVTAANDPSFLGNYMLRFVGNTYIFNYVPGGAFSIGGVTHTNAHANNGQGWSINNTTINVVDAGLNLAIGTVTVGQTYQIAVTLLATQFRIWIRGGTEYPSWTFIWQGGTNFGSSNIYLRLYNVNFTPTGNSIVNWVRGAILTLLASDSLALQNITSPVSGTTYSGAADMVLDISITVSNPLADSGGVYFRGDVSNGWHAYFDNAGAFKVDKLVDGSPDGSSPYINVAGVASAGNTYLIRVRAIGSQLYFYTRQSTSTSWTKRGNTLTDSSYVANVGVIPSWAGGWAGANLFIMPTTNTTYNTQLDAIALDANITEGGNNQNAATATRAASPLTTPTYDGSGQAVHPDVLYFPNGWNGHNYWMALTPYPAANDDYENPSILCSDDGDTWSAPAGLTNPIEPAPTNPAFNADPDIFMVVNTMYCIWRWATAPSSGNSIIYVKQSDDGVNWTNKQTVLSGFAYNSHLSPAIIYANGFYHMWYVEASISPYEIRYRYSASLTSGWSDPVTCTINISSGAFWHLNVTKIGAEYHMVISPAGTGGLYYAISTDRVTWYGGNAPFVVQGGAGQWDESGIYRSSLVAADSSLYLYYSARNASNVWHIAKTVLSGITP